MSGSGREDRGNRRRHFRNRGRDNAQKKPDNIRNDFSRNDLSRNIEAKNDKPKIPAADRPKWVPPQVSTEPIPQPDCPYCGKPIKDMAMAICDQNSDTAVHFDCMIARFGEGEVLEQGDAICYIGGGRFGVVHFGNPQNPKGFKIKKIFEWENKENRAGWRQTISDHFSVT